MHRNEPRKGRKCVQYPINGVWSGGVKHRLVAVGDGCPAFAIGRCGQEYLCLLGREAVMCVELAPCARRDNGSQARTSPYCTALIGHWTRSRESQDSPVISVTAMRSHLKITSPSNVARQWQRCPTESLAVAAAVCWNKAQSETELASISSQSDCEWH